MMMAFVLTSYHFVFFLCLFGRIMEDTNGLNLPTENCPRQDILFIQKVLQASSVHLVSSCVTCVLWCFHLLSLSSGVSFAERSCFCYLAVYTDL